MIGFTRTFGTLEAFPTNMFVFCSWPELKGHSQCFHTKTWAHNSEGGGGANTYENYCHYGTTLDVGQPLPEITQMALVSKINQNRESQSTTSPE